MEGPEGTATDAGGPRLRPAVLVALVLVGVALAVAIVLTVGGAFADRLEDDEPSTLTVPGPSSTTTEPEVVLAPPASVDNTTSSTGPG